MFEMFITTMTNSNDINVYFGKVLFDIPRYIINPNNKNVHPFNVFFPKQQNDSFEGFIKWFEVIGEITHNIYNKFKITLLSEVRCDICNSYRNPNIAYEHALSIP